jgi:serine protease Do
VKNLLTSAATAILLGAFSFAFGQDASTAKPPENPGDNKAPAASDAPPAKPKLSLTDIEDAFLDVAEKVRPGVVAIEAKHEGEEDSEIARNIGFSGVVWDDEGTIVAIGRDLESATEISVSPFEGEARKARFVGLDDETGVCVLKVDGDRKGLVALEHGKTEQIRPGSFCIAVGNPAGLRHSVAFGHIAATGRTVKRGSFVTKDAIQITLSVNPGDPGGLLADSRGRLVGVLSSSLRRPETLRLERDFFDMARRLLRGQGHDHDGNKPGDSAPGPNFLRRALEGASSAFAQNVGFALPVEEVTKAVERVKHLLGKPWLGVDVRPLDDDDRDELGVPRDRGILVVGVRADSPAARASVRPNDVLLSWNGTPVADGFDLRKIVQSTPLGTAVKLEVSRGKDRLVLDVRIEARGGGSPRTDAPPSSR